MAGRERGTGKPDGYEPSTHRMVAEQRWFDDFRIGERFPLPSRNMTKATLLAFQAASGENHLIHYDHAYCRAYGLHDMLAHGHQVAIQTAAGAGLFPHLVQGLLWAFPRAVQPLPAPGLRWRQLLRGAQLPRADT